MAKTIKFPPSSSPDVVGYRLYLEEAPNEVTYDSEFIDLGNPVDPSGLVVVDLTQFSELTTKDGVYNIGTQFSELTTKDGVYNIGITAIDDAGNESSMSKASDVPLDFVAPDPPGALVIS